MCGRIFSLVAILLAIGPYVGWADSWAQPESLDAVRSAAANITSVHAAFVQEKHLPILAKPLVSKGVLYYQTPDALRWEYLSPIRSVLLMYKGKVRRFTRENDAFVEEANAGLDAMQVVLEQITHWLTGDFERDPMFAAELRPGRLIELTPRQKGMEKVLQRIALYLGRRPGVIDRVLIYEGPEAYTELRFSDTELNQALDVGIFQHVP
jgi:outer membrane lipoprotein-sorting protein